ncbi:F-box protein At2g39490-like [Durio zibethinus]|uniref:F-box protein At2g39490-like n=1 Tax=Durio zibethinus TaxID=66656 RepID=A0A6P5YUQ2_DURZI|nr:F-box protein At2g39490-like [Durio zibethinus]
MGKKNRNKKNQWKKRLDSNPGSRLSISLLDVRKELDSEQRNDDIISSMDDDILCHIISFLPFKTAVQTSFLSTRWKDLWKRNFPVRKGTIDDTFIAISSFLHGFSDQSQQPRSNFGFQFNFGKGSFLSAAGEPNKALHLDFSNVKHEFPWRFDWLLEINDPSYNHWYNFLLSDFDIHTHRPSPFIFKVKTLHLVSVSYLSSEAISSMMSNFEFLESLAIEKCNGLRSLRIKAGNPRLKKLTILDCQQLESIHLKCYINLQSLRYRGKLLSFECDDRGSFWFGHWYNAFYLKDAMLDLRQGPGYSNISSCGFKSIFNRIKRVESLTLCRWIFEALICPMLPFSHFLWGFQLVQLKELWWIDYSKERYNSNALISFLKLSPRLRRLYITVDPKSYNRTNTTEYSVEAAWLPRLEDLRVVKLEGFPNEKEEIILAKRLKQEFNVEPLIVAKSNYLNCVRLLVKKPNDDDELLKERKDSYKFIETRVEHLYDLCPKHVHMSL